jgi:hypothetical protein
MFALGKSLGNSFPTHYIPMWLGTEF